MKKILILPVMLFMSFVVAGCGSNGQGDKPAEKVYTLSSVEQQVKLFESFTITLKEGENAVKPSWTSENETICTVSNDGLVASKRLGSTKIKANYEGKDYFCSVTVVKPDVVPFLEFTSESKNFSVNETVNETVEYTYNGSQLSKNELTYEVVNKQIAEVTKTDDGCKITGLSSGETDIKVVADWFGVELFDTLHVTVLNNAELILSTVSEDLYLFSDLIHPSKCLVEVEELLVNGEKIDNPDVTWSTDNEKVFTVTDGEINATGIGEGVLTCSWSNGDISTEAYVGVRVLYNEQSITDKFDIIKENGCEIDLTTYYPDDLGNLKIYEVNSSDEIPFGRNGNKYTLDDKKLPGGENVNLIFVYDNGLKLNITTSVCDLLIDDVESLLEFRDNISAYKYVKLANNINLGDTTFGRAIHGNTFVGEFEDTETADSFTGVFDGQGYKLVNGYYGGCGLFKNIAANAVVKNVEFKNALLTSYEWKEEARSTSIFANYIEGTINNVLIDTNVVRVIDESGSGGNEGSALCRNFGENAKISNVIVYWKPFECRYSDGGYEGSTNATYGTAIVNVEYQLSNLGALKNAYLFTPYDPAGHISVIKNDYDVSCEDAGLTEAIGFDLALWDFSGIKAKMISACFEISSLNDLLKFRDNIFMYENVKLMCDIDLEDTTFGRALHGNTFVGEYENTETADTFTGVFDGQGHKLLNGYFGGCGFFKNIAEGAVVKNIEFKNASLTSYGWKSDARSTTIFANYVSGEVKDVLIDCKVIRVLDDNGTEGSALCRNFTSTANVSNVIVYWHPFECRYADGSREGDTNATYGTAIVNVEYQTSNLGTLNNVYLFSPYDPAGHTSVTKYDYTTTCAEAGLPTVSGFDQLLWDFSGTKAELLSIA